MSCGGSLHTQLAHSLRECRSALADYQAGVADATDLRRRLVANGLVEHDDEVWILDLDAARWCRFDGLRIVPAPPVLDDAQFSRWRTVIDRLNDQLDQEDGS